MALTTAEICQRYARLANWDAESVDAFVELLHPEVEWLTKRRRFCGKRRVELLLRQVRYARWRTQGLHYIALVSGHSTDDGGHADCVVTVPIREPDKHDSRTYFATDGRFIIHILTYDEWMDRTWPYPERLKRKLAELHGKCIPINPVHLGPQPEKIVWPDDGRNLEDACTWRGQAGLTALRERMAEALDADPIGEPIPDLGLE
ncbi:MAG: hypothetical protein RJQ08_15655 [Salinisphaeraceae bacterium]